MSVLDPAADPAPAEPGSSPGSARFAVAFQAGGRSGGPAAYPLERGLTWAGVLVTAAASAAFAAGAGHEIATAAGSGAVGRALGLVVLTATAGFLIYGAVVYLVARLGYLQRVTHHVPAGRELLEAMYAAPVRPLLTLVPSYREEPAVVRQTLLSAALQEYPDKRVVLLIDDPPTAQDPHQRALLEAARALPGQLQELLAVPADAARAALAAFEARLGAGADADPVQLAGETYLLAQRHDAAAAWLEALARSEQVPDHAAALFVERVLRGAAREHRAEAARLRSAVAVPRGQLHLGYRSLVARFAVEFAGFERKAYVNLSHEPNKAMNLNSYLGLLGGAWREVAHPDGLHLVPAADDGADLVVREAAYVLTLDADSVLVPSYAARLVECLERPGHERVAVVQTPYSAFPGAPGALERMAGATTDMQFIVHQGFTRHGATFWVGANALIRWRAVAELARHETERGHTVVRFIQDRTVIEDTESSVDLLAAGWQLHNYPRRLSWSATPPDFGALVIQRRRWANGGLVILPKLLRHLLRTRSERGRDSGGWMRVHYLSSIAGVNIGLILLLDVPLPTPAATCWLPVAAAPYFAMYARDLRQAGYRMRDVARVYALNLLLVPVNLAGVAKSVQQGLTRSKIPFGRTPKINGRTRVPVLYLLAPLVLSALWTLRAGLDLAERHWVHAGCVLLNVAAMTYAVARFIGGRALLADLRASTTARLRPARTARIVAPRRPTADDASSRI